MLKIEKNVPDDAAKAFGDKTLELVAELEEKFGERRRSLLKAREGRQLEYDSGKLPDFDPATESVRKGDWQLPPPPAALEDRRVEITGPCDRKMMINALNCGANVFMADLEDSHSPVWAQTVAGHVNLYDAARREIEFDDPASGKSYRLGDSLAVLIVRPRGLHLDEPAVNAGGRPVSASLFDFGVHMANNAAALAARDEGPFLYLPKLEHHTEAQLWSDVIAHAEKSLGIESGRTRVTLLIETLPAVFQMHEILHALKENIVGLNCGRWDYIFSYIKTFRKDGKRVLPERSQVHMGVPFLDAYSKLLVQTCHARGAHAMGGMSAFIPVRGGGEENDRALEMVAADKRREIANGHDGSWVAHPGLVEPVKALFDEAIPGKDQKSASPKEEIGQAELIAVPEGTISCAGFDGNVEVALLYTQAWLGGRGAVPIHNLMEDLATAEISRSQLWQWIRSPEAKLDDGSEITAGLFGESLEKARESAGGDGNLEAAADVIASLVLADELEPFLSSFALGRLA